MTPVKSKAIVRRFFEILQTGNLSLADEIVAEDYRNHNPVPVQAPGRAGFKAFVSHLHAAFPDLQIAVEEEIAEGNKVMVRYQVLGTHRGDFLGVTATGRRLTWPAIMQVVISNGQVKEIWLQWDRMAVMQQLGVVPQPA